MLNYRRVLSVVVLSGLWSLTGQAAAPDTSIPLTAPVDRPHCDPGAPCGGSAREHADGHPDHPCAWHKDMPSHHEHAHAGRPPDSRPPGPPPGAMMGGPPPGPMMAIMGALCALDLTEAQQAQLKTIHEQTHSKMRELMESDQHLEAQFTTTLPGDPGYADLMETVKRHASSMIQLHSDAMVQIYQSVLTDAQRTQVAHVLATRKQGSESDHASPHRDHHPK